MAALSGAQPAQRSAGPKRAAWRALFRFPIPQPKKGGTASHLTTVRVRRSAVPWVYSQTKDFRKKKMGS